jgi:hypothetical protein
MTEPNPNKGKRLLALEREVRLLRRAIPDAVKFQVQCALQTATVSRLLGENAALRRNIEALKGRIRELSK